MTSLVQIHMICWKGRFRSGVRGWSFVWIHSNWATSKICTI